MYHFIVELRRKGVTRQLLSFCTNHYLNGMPVTLIMAISGHKTERAFMRYIKIDKDQKIDLFRENMKGRKSQ
jgi:hypothetical protein